MPDRTCLVALAEDPDVLFRRVRIRVTPVASTLACRAVVIQGNVQIGEVRLRVQTEGGDADDVFALVRARMGDRLAGLLANDSRCYRGIFGDPPQGWLPPRDLSLLFGGRAVIRRRKAVRLRRETVDEAAFFMDAMDYDFHLFSCLDTGQDSVVYRCGPTGYKVALLSLANGLPQRRDLPITVNPRRTPTLTPRQAAARLRETEMPFVFFADADAARPSGRVLYQRYDGHYGLIGASAGRSLEAAQPLVIGEPGAGEAGFPGLERVVETAAGAGAGHIVPVGAVERAEVRPVRKPPEAVRAGK